MRAVAAGLAALLMIPALAVSEEPEKPNGFDLSAASIPRDKIEDGGPPRDGIRSVDEPSFVPVEEASWVRSKTPVLGLRVGDVARVYPVHLLEFHQIVNDRLGELDVAVTYDPLAGAPVAWRRRAGERVLTFGVSGLIYNSNFLMYDRETESLWSQFTGRALAGPLVGEQLERVPVRQEPLGVWLERAAKSVVLARPEPERFDYRYSPYSAYWVEDAIPFPVEARDKRYHAKELVLGVRVGERTRAYLGSLVTRAGGRAEDEFAGHPVRLTYSSELGVFRWDVPEDVEVTESFWFAWKAFHPDTEIWKPPAADAP